MGANRAGSGRGSAPQSGGGREPSIGRRAGRHTTFQAEAYKSGVSSAAPDSAVEPDATGIAPELGDEDFDSYHQPTAMLDKAELLGDLAELNESAPETRAEVEAEVKPKGFRLIVVGGPDLGMEWAFKKPEITIGRGTENEIDFSDIAVSRRHVKIALDGATYTVSDLGSNNGTLLNGVRIERPEPLCPGDEIVLGARTLRFVELNEAPPTAAAHPVAEPSPEPVAGSPSEIAPVAGAADGPGLGAASQIDVGVVPDVDGPKKDEAGEEKKEEAPAKPGRRGLRLAVAGLVSLVVLGGLGFAGWQVYRRIAGKGEAEKALKARTEFLQGVELVKSRRFADARVLFDDVLVLRPEYGRAKEYKAHCDKEIAFGAVVEEAKTLHADGKTDEALAKLKTVDPDSAWAAEAARLEKDWARARAEARLSEARSRFAEGDSGGAMDLVIDALRAWPTLTDAQALRDELEEAAKAPDTDKKPNKPKIPPELVPAVELSKSDRIPAAIDAAEAAGTPAAETWVARMKKLKVLLSEAQAAHRAKAAAELIRIGPQALDLDRQIAFGEGKVRERIRTYYADGLYLKGLEAYGEEDYPRAFDLLSEAKKIVPEHRLAGERLDELGRKARELYYEGFVKRETNADETRKIFRRITQMTRPDNQFHQKALRWLSGRGG